MTIERGTLPPYDRGSLVREAAIWGFDADRLRSPAETVRIVCEENFDLLIVTRTMGAALHSLAEGKTRAAKDWGQSVFLGISDYFQREGITSKLVLPEISTNDVITNSLLQDGERYVQELTEELGKVRSIGKVEGAFAQTILADIRNGLSRARSSRSPHSVTLEIPQARVSHHPGLTEHRTHRGVLVNLMNDASNQDYPEHQILTLPERVVVAAQELSDHKVPGVADPFQRRCGGVSVRDIFLEHNEQAFIRKIMTYMKNIPRGDEFWQRYIHRIFLTGIPTSHTLSETELQHPDFIRRLMAFKLHLVEGLFTPAITGQQPDHRFDRDFKELITILDGRNLHDLQIALFTAIVFIPGYTEHFNPGLQEEAVTADMPVGREVTRGRAFVRYLMDAQMFLRTNWPKIRANWVERFGEGAKMQIAYQRFENILEKISFVTAGTEEFMEVLQSELGEEQFTTYFTPVEEGVETRPWMAPLAVEYIDEVRTIKRGKTVVVRANSPLGQMGIDEISFAAEVGKDDLREVAVIPRNGKFIAAWLRPDGVVERMNVDHGDKYKEMVLFLMMLMSDAYKKSQPLWEPGLIEAKKEVDKPAARRGLSPDEAHDLLLQYTQPLSEPSDIS